MKAPAPVSGMLLTAVSALCFSTLPIFGVAAYRAGANVVTLLGVRFLIASVLLWTFLLLTRRVLPDRRTGLLLFLMGGVGYTAMSMLYLSSVAADRLSPALAALLLYTYPAIVAVEAWWFDGHSMNWRQSGALVLALVGVALVLASPGQGTLFTPVGAALALGAALVYGTYVLFGSRVTRQTSPMVATTFVSTAAAFVFLVYGTAAGQLVRVEPAGWWAMAGMALVATVMAVGLFFAGLEQVGPARASIISTLEPVGTAGLSVLLYGDRPGWVQILGGALVLVSVIWLQLSVDA